jgi:hypothetical protein
MPVRSTLTVSRTRSLPRITPSPVDAPSGKPIFSGLFRFCLTNLMLQGSPGDRRSDGKRRRTDYAISEQQRLRNIDTRRYGYGKRPILRGSFSILSYQRCATGCYSAPASTRDRDIGELDSPGPNRGKRGAMWREPLTGNMGEDLSLTNLSTQRQRIAELARLGTRGNLRAFLCQRVTDSVINATMSEALP